MFEGFKVRTLRKKIELETLQKVYAITEATTKDALRDRDEDAWSLIGGSDARKLDVTDQDEMRESAQRLYVKNPHARNIIRLFEKYIAGRGFKIDPGSEDEQLIAYWDNFWKRNKMFKRAKEIVRRAMRDGEVFVRFFIDGVDPVIRFMNAKDIRNPRDQPVKNSMNGIETNPEDIEDVTGYWYRSTLIPAEEVLHLKILVDSDVLRGRSLLEVIMPFLSMYYKWLNTRMKLSQLRSTVALVKKVTGSKVQAANIVSDQNTANSSAPDDSKYTKAPEGVSVITTNQGVDYDFKSPQLDAADVHHDGRAVLLAIAAGVGLPEFMVTSDASNANYASTMVSEGPAVMEFEDWQDIFSMFFQEIYEKVILTGIDQSEIPDYEIATVPVVNDEGVITEVEIVREMPTDCTITYPDIAVRDVEGETKSLILQNNQGWTSGHTASAELGRDYDVEQELLIEEMEDEADEMVSRDDPENEDDNHNVPEPDEGDKE